MIWLQIAFAFLNKFATFSIGHQFSVQTVGKFVTFTVWVQLEVRYCQIVKIREVQSYFKFFIQEFTQSPVMTVRCEVRVSGIFQCLFIPITGC